MVGRLKKLAVSYIGLAVLFLIGFIYVFVQIANELKENELEKFDSVIIGFVQGFVSPHLTKLMLFFTMLGSVAWLTAAVVVVVAISLIKRRWWTGFFIGLSSGAGSLFNILLKTLFHRERPDIQPLIVEPGFSFPSGHSMGSFIFYGAAAYLVFHYSKTWGMKIFGTGLLLLLIFLVGLSRIYLGVHFPSDIIGGFSAGGAWLTVCIILFNYMEKREKVKAGGTLGIYPNRQ